MTERLFSTYQVADLLGTTPAAVAEWIQRGWLPFKRLLDGPVRISETGLVKFLKHQGVDIGEIMAKIAEKENEGGSPFKQNEQAEDVVDSEAIRQEREMLIGDSDEQSLPETEDVSSEPNPQNEPIVEEVAVAEVQGEPSGETPPDEDAVYESDTDVAVESPAVADEQPGEPDSQAEAPDRVEARPLTGPAWKLADAIVYNAVADRASDLYLEPSHDGLKVRVRVDGVVRSKGEPGGAVPGNLAGEVVAHLKSQAGLDSALTSRPQVGTFELEVADRVVGFRLATCPTLAGERVAVQISDPQVRSTGLSQLRLLGEDEQMLRSMLGRPSGMILAAGSMRTGVGALLGAMTAELNSVQRLILAVGSDSMGEVDGVCRAAANPRDGFGYGEAIAALADQDADVVVSGDLPDPASAAAALDVAGDGRIMLAGMSAAGAAEAAGRLIEMGLAGWPLATNLIAVIAVRTVRAICEACKTECEPDTAVLEQLGWKRSGKGLRVFEGAGCDACGGSGYLGTTALVSAITVDATVAEVLRNAGDAAAIMAAAKKGECKSLTEAAFAHLCAGVTTLDELARIMPVGE